MPALTHNRVKNGFNGGIRKNNATMGVVKRRTYGATQTDGMRKKASLNGVGSVRPNIKAAYNRRVNCDCVPKPTRYTVTVVNDGGNKFLLNGNKTLSLTFEKGKTYIFDQSHTSNKTHALQFVTTLTGSTLYQDYTIIGVPGNAGARVVFTPKTSGTVFIRCLLHGSGMGSYYNNSGSGITVN